MTKYLVMKIEVESAENALEIVKSMQCVQDIEFEMLDSPPALVPQPKQINRLVTL